LEIKGFSVKKSLLYFLMIWGLLGMFRPVNAASEKGKPTGTGEKDIIPVKAVQITPLSDTFIRRLPATVMTEVETRLAFRVSGRISNLPAEVGQLVKQGDLISLLDLRDFTDEEEEAKAALEQAQARRKDAGLHLKRIEKLWADQDVDISQLDKARADARAMGDQVKMQKRQWYEARRRLSYTRLEAPYTGIVARKEVNLYDTVTAGQPVVLFVDLSLLKARAQLSPSLMPEHARFVKYNLVIPALNGLRLPATLQGIGPRALPKANTFPITVTIQTGPESNLRPGMNGLLEITVKRATEQSFIQIPLSALSTAPNGNTRVWVVEEKSTVQPRQVTTGGLTEKGIEIKSGLSAGEWVVTAGLRLLKPGKRVLILKTSP
jgi:multidrug efflux system membrane fusion protein